MKTHTNVDVFAGQNPRTAKNVNKKEQMVFGKSFAKVPEFTKIFSQLLKDGRIAEIVAHEGIEDENPILTFYTFLIKVNFHFNDFNGNMSPALHKIISQLAVNLSIPEKESKSVVEYLESQEPYVDKNLAVYFDNNKKEKSTKYFGTNIMYSRKKCNEIVYLKYFETYDLFLTKTFVKNSNPYNIPETPAVNEVNLLEPTNYFMDDFGFNSFQEIVHSVKNHKPFQYFELPATANTPKVVLDPKEGKIVIAGSSSPFSPTNFFGPILDWLENYRVLCEKPLHIYIMLDYFNTYTSKFLLRLSRVCDTMSIEGKEIKIFWYFDPEDTDMKDFGEHLSGIFNKGFEFCLMHDATTDLI